MGGGAFAPDTVERDDKLYNGPLSRLLAPFCVYTAVNVRSSA